MKHVLIGVWCLCLSMGWIAMGEAAEQEAAETARIERALEQLTWVSPETELVVGKPIEVNGLKLIPLATVGMGIGQSEARPDAATMAGAGGILMPVGVIVVSGQEVRIVRISKGIVEQVVSGLAPLLGQILPFTPRAADEEASTPPTDQTQADQGGGFMATYWKIALVFFLVWLVLALIVQTVFPDRVMSIAALFRYNYLQISLLGMVGYGVMFLLAAIFTVSIIGIPFTFALLILTVLFTLFGTIGFALFVGQESAAAFKYHYSEKRFLLIGGILFGILGMIPGLGVILWAMIAIFGFGAVLQMHWENMRKHNFTR
ncbi:hypothetical protein GF339_07330 [candidate division KSB3 bacterium]|uniref:DUF1189 domain-containing protein n=1 Tax=candidate division KSB3 bacterium TaxID=2044937 RepID=A0A9D5JUQ8_9BACT|nr:hypothetical protein [candidate division KSB3 bacterium]MBD3324381.1 hypothetical protein [candidate division KSB3 bacterium]